jgi:small subunit ribosomal protein S21
LRIEHFAIEFFESFEGAFRRFKKSCEKAGILSEVKKREHFEKPSVRLKKKSLSARKRAMKKTRRGGSSAE